MRDAKEVCVIGVNGCKSDNMKDDLADNSTIFAQRNILSVSVETVHLTAGMFLRAIVREELF